MLEVEQLRVDFGGVLAVADASFTIERGEALGLIGPNGAGKSTTIAAVSGFIRSTHGRVSVDGVDITGWRPQRIYRGGVARTFQHAELAAGMTVEQNLMLASLGRGKRAARIRAAEVSEMFGITGHLSVPASELPYGLRRLVEVARAMMSKPRVVLLDEPGAGLTDQERADLAPLLRLLADQGLAVLLVDHNVSFVVESCVRLVVLDAGVVIAEGTPGEIRNNPAVVEAYLGRSA